jgi:hypothetical protein
VPTQRSATPVLALPGPSRTITVEPIEVPVAPPPAETPEQPVEAPEPDRREDPVPTG